MRARPRQIDNSKPFVQCPSLDQFNQEEGQEQEVKASEKIITPDMLLTQPNQNNQSAMNGSIYYYNMPEWHFTNPALIYYKPKAEKQETTLKPMLPYGQREDFIKNKYPIYPDGYYYELTDDDCKFLNTFNEKLSMPISIEELEQYISLLDSKSGKDVVIDFPTFHSLKLELPKSISQLTYQQQESLYIYYKNLREHQSRPLLRALMHPYSEDQNPQLAFRPRSAPVDRTMRLRRGAAQNSRGVSEMENLGQKVIQLRKELLLAQTLVEQCLQREKGMELDRRYRFCQIIKQIVEQLKVDKEQSQELQFWQKECFIKDVPQKCAINIVERADEMFDGISQQINQWKDENEKQRRDKNRKEDSILKFEKQFEELLVEKRSTSINSEDDRKIKAIPQPLPPPIQAQLPPPPPPDERIDSVGRFIATLYLEARRYKLYFDPVMSDSFPIVRAAQQPDSLPSQQKCQIKYQLLMAEGNDLIYRIPPVHPLITTKYYWEEYQDVQRNNTALYQQYSMFKEKVNDIMEMADMDQMLYNTVQEDERQEEEELKTFRKKIKISQNKSYSVNNGIKNQ